MNRLWWHRNAILSLGPGCRPFIQRSIHTLHKQDGKPNKRHKPNDYCVQHEEASFASNTAVEHRHGWSQGSNRFEGQGVSAHNGQVDIGRDFIVNNNNLDRTICKDEKRILLESLRFDQIDARQMSIKKAHPKTCRWLLKTPQYLDWLDTNKLCDHNGFLWIKGKPGAGKSTLMSFAVAFARRTMKENIVISFFLNARGDDLEKSTIGLYRSLLLQLLEACPQLQSVLDRVRVGHEWTIESLKFLFEEAVLGLGKSSLICFIDALDECEESQIRDMVSFLSELAVSTETKLHICFASRYYPHITIEKGLSIKLENQEEHRQDIANYLSSALSIGHSKLAEQIRSDLQEKASGVFMWVVLVVDILNKEYDQGRIHALRERLKSIPRGLHDLFHDILTRDDKNIHGLLLSIQWVLYARSPLTPKELYFAILSGLEPDNLSSCHSDEISEDDIRRYILNNSKGLTEYTKSKISTVQFIHESVRDFLLKKNGLEAIWPDLGGNFKGQSHEKLKKCCVNYISSELVIHLDHPSPLPKATSQEAAALRHDVGERFPFLEYATKNILYHADEAESRGVSQKDFLPNFSITEWLNHHNLFEKHQIRRYSSNVCLAYILAEGDLAALIRIETSSQSCFAIIEHERYGTPIFAALATNSIRAVQAFLEIQEEIQPRDSAVYEYYRPHAKDGGKGSKFSRDFTFSRQRGIVSHITENGNEAILAFFLATGIVDVDLNNSKSRTPLSFAAENGHEVSVQLLLNKGAKVNVKDKDGWTPLSWAAMNGNEANVRLLLENGAEIEFQDEYGQTPLSRAAASGNEATVRLLLEMGAEIEAQDEDGQTPLSWAAASGNEATVRLLLETGAEIEFQDEYGQTPLSRAAASGNEATVRLLLEMGAEIEAQDEDGQTPLSWAAASGNEATVRLLLETGAEIEAQDVGGRTPLSWAAASGNEATVRLLLENGAEIEVQDKYGQTPLSQEVMNGNEVNVRLLLETGAEIEAQDKYGQTPLSRAAASGNEATVRLLLEMGAEIEAQDEDGQTPLSWAAASGNEATVRLLLETGAEIEAQDVGGRTPLSWAAASGNEATVRLLLENGAEIEVKDKDSWTPLSLAARRWDEATIRLLLENGAEIEVQDKDGRTPLSWAVRKGNNATVRLLLENGAEIEVQDKDGRTPLSWEIMKGNNATVRLLLENGAEIEVQDKYGLTPLSWAAVSWNEATVRLLLEMGAEIEAQDKDGQTPPLWAAESGAMKIVQ